MYWGKQCFACLAYLIACLFPSARAWKALSEACPNFVNYFELVFMTFYGDLLILMENKDIEGY